MGNLSSQLTFDFDYYRFNGRGNKPTLVASVNQANFMRSRHSIEEPLLDLVSQRVQEWAGSRGISINPRKPYPSKLGGRYWVEVHFRGLSL